MAADAPAPAAIRDLDRLFRTGTLNGCSEGQLLDRFLGSRDEYAFAAIVSKHGPMVLRTCRALLGDPHDADDAFQATFLVLARRAGSIRNAELLGPWLHRVARRVAARSRAAAARRLRRERPSPEALAAATARSTLPDPDRLALHEAIDRLPEAYRRVLILCDLQGHSHAEAASRLGCPIGTVKGRQSRARSLLRRRLSRAGLAPASGPIVLLPSALDAAIVPAPLLARTARAAVAFASGGALATGTVPAGVVSLASGVLTGMIAQTFKLVSLAGVLSLGAVAAGGLIAPAFSRGDARGDGISTPVVASADAERPEGTTQAPREPEPGDPGDPVGALLGIWEVISIEGEPVPAGDWRRSLEIRRVDRRIAEIAGSDATPVLCIHSPSLPPDESRFDQHYALVDPIAVPARIDGLPMDLVVGPGDRTYERPAVYRIEGDTLIIHAGDVKPPYFEVDASPSTRLTVYRRVDPSRVGEAPTPDTTSGSPANGPIEPAPADAADDAPSPTRTAPPEPEDRLAPLLGTWRRTLLNGIPTPEGAFAMLDLRRADPDTLSGLKIQHGEPILCKSVVGPLPGGGFLNADGLAIVLGDADSGHFDFLYVSAFAPPSDAAPPPFGSPGIYRIAGDTLTLLSAPAEQGRPSRFDQELTPGMKLEVYERSPVPPPTPTREPAHSYGVAPGGLPAIAPLESTPGRQAAEDSRRGRIEELEQQRMKVLAEYGSVRPEADLLALEAEVLGDLYRKQLAQREELRLALGGFRDDQRRQAEAELARLEASVAAIKRDYAERALASESKQGDVRGLDAALDRIDRLMTAADGPSPPAAEAIERRLAEIESKLDRLVEQARTRPTP